MRVLFVSSYPHLPEITGGLQTTTHDLCRAIREIGAEAAVLCGRSLTGDDTQDGLTSSDDSLGYLVLRTGSPTQALPMAAAAWGADVIVVQSGTALAPMVAASLATGRPTAVYLHNVETHQLAGNLVAHPSLLYLANSDFTAARWRALYGIDCAVIPPVIAPEPYLADTEGDKVLFINPTPIKGVEIMFALAAACPELPFLVMESWDIEPNWRAYCQARAAQLGNIEWRRPSRDMREVFGQSRVLLMPSVWEESFGRTAVEAQLNGLPVLASRRGALPQLVGEGGLVLDPHAPIADWAQALRRLYASTSGPAREAARQQAANHIAATPLVVARLLGLLVMHASRSAEASEAAASHAEVPRDGLAKSSAAPDFHANPRYIAPRMVRLEDCDFYHSCTLGSGQEIVGEWDLRDNTSGYLGEVDFAGTSVLEVGPASGFLSFHMEKAGATVTCLEPPMSYLWDIVPFEGFDIEGWRKYFIRRIEGVRNSFWYLHRDCGSQVKMLEADPYDLPADLGPFDIGLLASVLVHCRRPFDLLQSVAKRTRHTIIVTESYDASLGDRALCQLQPHLGARQVDTWWQFTPTFFTSTLGVLGFTDAKVLFHTQKQPAENREVAMFTVVCSRPDAAAH